MPMYKVIAIILIAAGMLGLIYKGFTYTKDTHEADLGPLSISVDDNEYIDIPTWAGFGAVMLGSILLLWKKNA